MSKEFQVGDRVELVEGVGGFCGRQLGIPYMVTELENSSVRITGSNYSSAERWYLKSEVRLWWRDAKPTVIVDESAAQDLSRGVFVSVDPDGDMSAEFNVKVYADALSALKDSNCTRREVFFVPYPTSKAVNPVWEEVR